MPKGGGVQSQVSILCLRCMSKLPDVDVNRLYVSILCLRCALDVGGDTPLHESLSFNSLFEMHSCRHGCGLHILFDYCFNSLFEMHTYESRNWLSLNTDSFNSLFEMQEENFESAITTWNPFSCFNSLFEMQDWAVVRPTCLHATLVSILCLRCREFRGAGEVEGAMKVSILCLRCPSMKETPVPTK